MEFCGKTMGTPWNLHGSHGHERLRGGWAHVPQNSRFRPNISCMVSRLLSFRIICLIVYRNIFALTPVSFLKQVPAINHLEGVLTAA